MVREPAKALFDPVVGMEENTPYMEVHSYIAGDSVATNIMAAGIIRKHLLSNQYDLVHLVYLSRVAFIAAAVCRELKIPYIASARGSDVERGRFDPQCIVGLQLLCRNAAVVTCVTRRMVDILQGLEPREYRWFYNSIMQDEMIDVIKTKENSQGCVLIDGSDPHKKGLYLAISSIKRTACTDLSLEVLGKHSCMQPDGNCCPACQLIEAGRAFFVEDLNRKHVTKRLLSSLAFLQSSPTEGCPNLLLEAIRVDCPVIASRAGAADELLRHKETALLFDPWSVDELVDCLDTMANNPLLARELAASARELLNGPLAPALEKRNWLACYSDALS